MAQDIPISAGLFLRRPTDTRVPHLEPSGSSPLRHRRVWGYFGELKIIAPNSTSTGAQLHVIILTHWRKVGDPEELRISYMYARANFFASTLLPKSFSDGEASRLRGWLSRENQ